MISCDFFNEPKARKQGFLIFSPQNNKKTNKHNQSFISELAENQRKTQKKKPTVSSTNHENHK